MAQRHADHEDDRQRHPWEHLEWILQLLYWVRPNCRNWNEAANEMRKALIVAAAGFLSGRTAGDVWQLAEDISQEWWNITLFRLFENYNPAEPLFPYGYEALRRLCLPHTRRNAQRELPGLSHDPLDHRCKPRRDERQRELRDTIGRALWQLPKQQRQAVVRRHVWKVSLVYAAAREGCTPNALYLRVLHGMKRLEVSLAEFAWCFRKKRRKVSHVSRQ
jgi:RNA polymerase sigma factor (sigma-70 family)